MQVACKHRDHVEVVLSQDVLEVKFDARQLFPIRLGGMDIDDNGFALLSCQCQVPLQPRLRLQYIESLLVIEIGEDFFPAIGKLQLHEVVILEVE